VAEVRKQDMGKHKPLSPIQAAARLNICVDDLPRKGSWSREQVRSLRAERPAWLTQARRVYASRKAKEAACARQAVDVLLDEGGYTAPDTRREDMVLYADEALLYLLHRGVANADAEAAVDRRWPSTCADDEEWLFSHG
jgi:hypothetical protein